MKRSDFIYGEVDGDGACFFHSVAWVLTMERPSQVKKNETLKQTEYRRKKLARNLRRECVTWLDNNLNPIRILSDTVSYLPVTTDTLFGLSAGTYYYQVQRNGCSVDNPTPVTIGPNLIVDATIDMTQSVTQLSCFGDLTNDIWVDVSDNFLASGVSNSFTNGIILKSSPTLEQ